MYARQDFDPVFLFIYGKISIIVEVLQMSENNENLSMSDHELLMRLAKQQKTAMWHRRIIAYVEVLILILLVAMVLIVGPKLLTLTNDMAATLERINHLIDQTEPAVEGLSKLDYDGLNTSITSLTESVDQFSGFMNKLSGFGGLFR